MEGEVTRIPATKDLRAETWKNVGIYCRVSSAAKSQLRSMAAQVSGLTRFVLMHRRDHVRETIWSLTDIYIDVASGKDNDREQYRRLLEDAKRNVINLVVVKSSSRLGRDTVETIQACRELAAAGCDIYFQNADSFYSEIGSFVAEITAAFDQADNESRSENIRWGIRRSLENGSSTIYDRVCYGYVHDENGKLVIKEEEAVVVRKIFLLYLSGASVLKIKSELEKEGIPAPRGGPIWAKKTIEKMLVNQKYTGTSLAHTSCIAESDDIKNNVWSDDKGHRYVTMGVLENHPPIITAEIFDKVQQMRLERSNIVYNPDGSKSRKGTHYSTKKKQETAF